MSHVRLDRTLWLNADKTKVVEEGDEEAAFLYGITGQLKPVKEAQALGLSLDEVSGDELKDVVHVEVESPNNLPGSLRVEGAGKATIPITQADRAAVALGDRQAVSGVDRRRTEGEAFLSGELPPIEEQTMVGQTSTQKQVAKQQPGTQQSPTPTTTQPNVEEAQKVQQTSGNKMAEQKQNK